MFPQNPHIGEGVLAPNEPSTDSGDVMHEILRHIAKQVAAGVFERLFATGSAGVFIDKPMRLQNFTPEFIVPAREEIRLDWYQSLLNGAGE